MPTLKTVSLLNIQRHHLKHITPSSAAAMEKRGEAGWHCIYNASGRVIGREFRMNELTRSLSESPCTLNESEMELNGLSERYATDPEEYTQGLIAEVRAKVKWWPFIGEPLKVCV